MSNTSVHTTLVFSAILFALGACSEDARLYRNDHLGWEMRVPDQAKRMGKPEIDKIRQEGEMLIGSAAEAGEASTAVESLLWFRFDNKNMFSSNLVSLQNISRVKYQADNEKIRQLIKTVLEAQEVPHRVHEGSTDIDGKTFETFTVEFRGRDGSVVATQRQYKRFFGDQELSVTISFSNPQKGEQMFNAWRDSQFD